MGTIKYADELFIIKFLYKKIILHCPIKKNESLIKDFNAKYGIIQPNSLDDSRILNLLFTDTFALYLNILVFQKICIYGYENYPYG